MTPESLEQDWLSLRYWALKCVLPSMLVLLAILAVFNFFNQDAKDLDHNAVIVGFFTFYFVIVKGGHLLMVRSLHKELKRKYLEGYTHKLGYISRAQIKRRNIGFTLARIKRDLITEEMAKKSRPLG